MGRALGVTEEQLRDLPRYRHSSAFSPLERLAMNLAVEMAKTPVALPPGLMDELRRQSRGSGRRVEGGGRRACRGASGPGGRVVGGGEAAR